MDVDERRLTGDETEGNMFRPSGPRLPGYVIAVVVAAGLAAAVYFVARRPASVPAKSLASCAIEKEEYIRRAYAGGEGTLTPTAAKGTLRVIGPPAEYTGLWRLWYENGVLASEGMYLEGKRHGYSSWWNDDGTHFATVHFVNGGSGEAVGKRRENQRNVPLLVRRAVDSCKGSMGCGRQAK